MQCHECGRAVQVGDRFCSGCGISLEGVTEPTAGIPAVAADGPTTEPPGTRAPEPSGAAEASASGDDLASDGVAVDETPATGDLPATELVEHIQGEPWGDDDPMWAATGGLPTTLPTTDGSVRPCARC